VEVTTVEIGVGIAAAVVALLAGIAVGRAGRRREARRIGELEVRLAERDGRIAQLESARNEAQHRRDEAEQRADEARDRLAGYESQVADHFTRTSDLLREMTLQYRAIYEHLAEGARSLCDDEGLRLERAEALSELPEESEISRMAEQAAGAGGAKEGSTEDDAGPPRA